jgi:hypothetical protein
MNLRLSGGGCSLDRTALRAQFPLTGKNTGIFLRFYLANDLAHHSILLNIGHLPCPAPNTAQIKQGIILGYQGIEFGLSGNIRANIPPQYLALLPTSSGLMLSKCLRDSAHYFSPACREKYVALPLVKLSLSGAEPPRWFCKELVAYEWRRRQVRPRTRLFPAGRRYTCACPPSINSIPLKINRK